MTKQPSASPGEIDIYDFDKTIYRGDSSLDFYLFCVRRKLLLLEYLPYQIWHLLLFVLRLESRTDFKSRFFVFLRGLDDTAKYVDAFWAANYDKIKNWYKDLNHSNDVIISASPEFLLRPAVHRLKARMLIATRMDPKTGVIDGQNCRGQQKVIRLRQALGEPIIRKVYSDSRSDAPLLALAKEKYFVKGDRVIKG